MKRILFILLLFFALSAKGQLLYQISGNGTVGKSYLLATYPTCDIQFFDTIPNLFKTYGRCNKVITDILMQDYEALNALRTSALLPDSIYLTNFYSDEEYEQINEALLLTLGMGMDQLSRMRPSYLTELYRQELLKKWMNYNEDRSSTIFFASLAAQTNKPVYALDEIGESLYMLFEREPMHFQCKELKNIIEYPEREIQQERTLLCQYKNGRLTDMAYQIEGPDNQSTISYSDYQVYCSRNKVWVKRLAPYLKDGGCFITLNAIYLGGEKGLIAQLKAAGYKVKPVNK